MTIQIAFNPAISKYFFDSVSDKFVALLLALLVLGCSEGSFDLNIEECCEFLECDVESFLESLKKLQKSNAIIIIEDCQEGTESCFSGSNSIALNSLSLASQETPLKSSLHSPVQCGKIELASVPTINSPTPLECVVEVPCVRSPNSSKPI